LHPQKTCKAIAFTCLWGLLEFHMFEQDSALAHQACKMVAFFHCETPDFMSTCCSVLTELEIWGKAQRESARRPKSDWGRNFEKWNSPGSKVTWPAHKCISIRKTRTIDL